MEKNQKCVGVTQEKHGRNAVKGTLLHEMTNRTQEKYFSGIGPIEIGDWDLIGYCEEAFCETAIFVS